MYPINLQLALPVIGFATANDETEHAVLAAMGYLPAPAKKSVQPTGPVMDPPLPEKSVESVRAQLDAAGITYDKRIGIDKLMALLPV